jgi:hypothetical protein
LQSRIPGFISCELVTQRRCAVRTLTPIEVALFLTLIVVGIALLH